MERGHWLLLICVALASFIDEADATAVNVALPTIGSEFSAGTGTVTWVILAYGIVLCSSLIIFGKLGDRIGLRKIFLYGYLIFLAGSILSALSTDIYQLIAFRMVQALGGAMLAAVDFALVTSNLPKGVKGKAVGIMGVFGAFGLAMGPLIGGYLTEYFGWRYIFLINIPIVIVGIILGLIVLPKPTPGKKEMGDFDFVGAGLLFSGLALFIFTLNMADEWGWSGLIMSFFFLSMFIAYVFYRREKRAAHPMLEVSLLKNKNFRMGNMAGLVFMMAFGGAFTLIPFYLEIIGELSPATVGLYMMALAVAMMIVGPIVGSWADRAGCRPFCIAGSIVMAVTFLIWSSFDRSTGTEGYLLALTFMGVGVGIFLSPNSSLILSMSPRDKEGSTASFMVTIQEMGATLGVVVLETALTTVLARNGLTHLSGSIAQQSSEVLIQGFMMAFVVACILCLAAAAFSWFAKDDHVAPVEIDG